MTVGIGFRINQTNKHDHDNGWTCSFHESNPVNFTLRNSLFFSVFLFVGYCYLLSKTFRHTAIFTNAMSGVTQVKISSIYLQITSPARQVC